MKKHMKNWIYDLLIMIAGGTVWAIAINMFTLPNMIAAGGFSGLGTVFYYAFHIPVGITMIVLNVPVFIFAWKILGRDWFFKSLIAMLITSIIIDIFSFLPQYTEDKMLAAVFGGILSGIGLGIIYMRGIATGGVDLIARMIKKYVAVPSYGMIIVILDVIVIVVSGIIFRDFSVMLYAAIVVYITGFINDKLLNGLDRAKLIYVVSTQAEQIAQLVARKLIRGVTRMDGVGGYTGEHKNILMIVVKPYEFFRLKAIVREVDKEAFIVVSDVSEVLGKGFRTD